MNIFIGVQSSAEVCEIMYKLELEGTYYEIGRQIGKALEKVKSYPPKFPQEVLEKSHPYEEVAKKYTPDLLEEFRGLADQLDIDYYVPITLELTPYRFQMTSCLVYAVSGEHTRSGLPILARSHEWKEEEKDNLAVCHTAPKDKLKSLGFTFHWPLVSRYGGMNEAGVALSSASSSFENSGPGIIVNIATRWILDNCRTTQEAVTFLEKMPKVWGETYVIIDKENTIAKVESHAKKTNVTYSKSGFTSNTLHFDTLEMQDLVSQEDRDLFREPFSARQNYLNDWFELNKGNITENMIQDVLKDHVHQMCYHGSIGLEICWSYILTIGKEEALVCAGRPCKNEFEIFKTPY